MAGVVISEDESAVVLLVMKRIGELFDLESDVKIFRKKQSGIIDKRDCPLDQAHFFRSVVSVQIGCDDQAGL